jgi:hypothetical protein
MASAGEKSQRLSEFLKDSFDLSELEMFLRQNGFEEVADRVSMHVGLTLYAFEVVQALDRRGQIDGRFFDLLTLRRSTVPTINDPSG